MYAIKEGKAEENHDHFPRYVSVLILSKKKKFFLSSFVNVDSQKKRKFKDLKVNNTRDLEST